MRRSAYRPSETGPFPRGARYNSYGSFLKEKFGCRVGKVVVDAGFTCPNRDGTVGSGGCTYCNNDSFRPPTALRPAPVARQVELGVERLKRRFRARKFIAYFQPFTNTHAPLDRLIPLYTSAIGHPDVVGLAIGTRPDCIDEGKLAWLEELARTHLVIMEYGLESMHDTTLARINRGHDYACWQRAVHATRGRGIYMSAHLILGFPWEAREEMLDTAPEISRAGLDFLKLHHLHVVRHTALAAEYFRQPFPLLEFDAYVKLVVDFLERLNPEIRIERLFGVAPDDLLIGPRWGKTGAEIQHGIEMELERRDTWQGRLYRGAT